jgi:hypothetical protein
MRKDVRAFIRRLAPAGLTVKPKPGHYRVLRDDKPLRKANGMPFMLPFSPDTIRRRAVIVERRNLASTSSPPRARAESEGRSEYGAQVGRTSPRRQQEETHRMRSR